MAAAHIVNWKSDCTNRGRATCNLDPETSLGIMRLLTVKSTARARLSSWRPDATIANQLRSASSNSRPATLSAMNRSVYETKEEVRE